MIKPFCYMAFIYFVRVILELSKKSKIKNISLTARLYIALGYHLSRSRPPRLILEVRICWEGVAFYSNALAHIFRFSPKSSSFNVHNVFASSHVPVLKLNEWLVCSNVLPRSSRESLLLQSLAAI